MLGKILGGGLGWILGGGPIGALIGVAIGSAFDKGGTSIFRSDEDPKQHGKKRQTQRGDFSAALIVVSAAVMTADGKILKSELDYVKRYFLQNFGEAIAIEKIKVLGEVLKSKEQTQNSELSKTLGKIYDNPSLLINEIHQNLIKSNISQC